MDTYRQLGKLIGQKSLFSDPPNVPIWKYERFKRLIQRHGTALHCSFCTLHSITNLYGKCNSLLEASSLYILSKIYVLLLYWKGQRNLTVHTVYRHDFPAPYSKQSTLKGADNTCSSAFLSCLAILNPLSCSPPLY